MEEKLRYHYQYHHNYPPTLTDEEMGGEEEPQKINILHLQFFFCVSVFSDN